MPLRTPESRRFNLETQHRNVPEDDLAADLQRVARTLKSSTVTWDQYGRLGHYSAETLRRRFGSWNAALERAGLGIGKRWRIPDEQLFNNLADIWMRLGRQPRRDDLDRRGSRISRSTYEARFGTWGKALQAFVAFANADDEVSGPSPFSSRVRRPRSPRQPSLRLRFKVLRRDRFRCANCGRSPARLPTVELHVDHVKPWSAGGVTVLENLRTLCSECNLGKAHLGEREA